VGHFLRWVRWPLDVRESDGSRARRRAELDAVDLDVFALAGAPEHVIERPAGVIERVCPVGDNDRCLELHTPIVARVARWMGVDVGGKRKAFDVALIEDRRLIGWRSRQSVDEVVAWAAKAKPNVIAIDSPRSCAPPGWTHRAEEKALRDAICGIRWTPPSAKLDGNPYYEWIVEGLRLYDALRQERARVIECFPTASWTRWHGARDGRRRSVWTREALDAIDLEGVPRHTNQDIRDAIAAALTARDYDQGRCERFGAIVVPQRA
jgi:predicted nuclease with RNAse H fold